MNKSLLIEKSATINDAITIINNIGKNKICLFVIENNKVIGSVTDGDIRRGLINGLSINDTVLKVAYPSFKYLLANHFDYSLFKKYRQEDIKYIPVLNDDMTLKEIFDFETQRSAIPVHAFLMAGGEGLRLRPLTNNTPKPLLKIGKDAIIVHNIKRLKNYGVTQITIAVKYLADLIKQELGDGSKWGVNINYIYEEEPLGTAGAIALQANFIHDTILLMNSDLLTNIDFETMYDAHISNLSALTVATIPYRVDVPFAVFDMGEDGTVLSIKEKPTFNYQANAGIYLLNKTDVNIIPKKEKFDATDLIEKLIIHKKKVATHPIIGYWLDIGRMSDYEKAQQDILNINF